MSDEELDAELARGGVPVVDHVWRAGIVAIVACAAVVGGVIWLTGELARATWDMVGDRRGLRHERTTRQLNNVIHASFGPDPTFARNDGIGDWGLTYTDPED